MAADQHVVGDIDVLGAAPLVLHAATDVDQARAHQTEARGAGDVLLPEQEADVGVPHRDPFEQGVAGGHQVEEHVGAVAVEHHLAVASGPDHDGLGRRAAGGQVVGPVEGRAVAAELRVEAAVGEAVVLVDAGMDLDHVARPHARREGHGMVRLVRAHEVGRQEAGVGRRLFRSAPAPGIDVEGPSARGGLRRPAGVYGDQLLPRPAHPIRIAEHEAGLVGGVRLEVQQAAGEHVRGDEVVEAAPVAVARLAAGNLLALQPEQGQPLAPSRLAALAVADVDAGVAVVVARDAPFEAQGDEGRPLDGEGAGGGPERRPGRGQGASAQRDQGHKARRGPGRVSRDAPPMVHVRPLRRAGHRQLGEL